MDPSAKTRTAIVEFGAEFLGTFIILFFGCAAGGAMQTGAVVGAWQAGIIWGIGVVAAIFASAPVSGAHLNPAITLGMAAAGKLSFWKIPHYVMAQLFGALAGAAAVYSFFWPTIAVYEEQNDIIRGQAGSFLSASMFRCTLNSDISGLHGFYIEWFITTVLLLAICYLNDPNASENGYGPFFPPLMVGLVVAILTAGFSPLTSCCLNPARDLGPRLMTLIAGWGKSAFPGEVRDPWWPFVCGPILGGITGVLLWEYVGAYMYRVSAEEKNMMISGMGSSIYAASFAQAEKNVSPGDCDYIRID